ncbi:MAG: hypothetical protein IJ677_08545 [Alphaproteobacteria bacterium]|nr:hypothetical protein [Alphaproteobacteria bacterium]
MKKNLLNRFYITASVSLVSLAFSFVGYAQTFAPVPSTSDSSGTVLDEVVVTGKSPTYNANFSGFNPTPLDGASININMGSAYDSPEDDDGTSGSEGNVYNMTTKITTNDNGTINETSDSSSFTITDAAGNGSNGAENFKADLSDLANMPSGGLSGFIPSSTLPTDKELSNLNDKVKKAQEDADKKKEEEELKQYTGLYNGRQILPDIMARHCRIKGEDVAKNVSLYVDCIKQYVSEMNNSNAAAKAKAQEEFEILRYKTLLDAASNAITKSQSVLNYENTMNEYNKANQDMQTEFDDNHALMATMSFVTDVMNSFRELQAEQLKYMAISGIVNVDPAVVMADEEDDETKQSEAASGGSEAAPEIHTIKANTVINSGN